MRQRKIQSKQTKNLLRTWFFDKPAKFAVYSFIAMFVVGLLYSLIAMLLNISDARPLILLEFAAFIWSICYLIKQLPHDNMYHGDFVALTNGYGILTTFIPLVTLLFVGANFSAIKYKLVIMHATAPTALWFIIFCATIVYLYFFGLIVSSIYAKYKRALEIGIKQWKIICSFPFAFIMMWTPGYLIKDNKTNSALTIKSRWFSKLNKWVIANKQNTWMAFLTLILFTNVFSGTSSLLLTGCLIILYVLLYIKHKKDFLKNINRGYALSAIGINVIIIFVLIIQELTKAN